MLRGGGSMRTLILLAVALLSSACTDARISELMSYGDAHHIRVYSGGVLIGQWITTGTVLNEGQSDGYVFRDAATKQMVRVSGEVIITLAQPAKPGVTLPTIPLV